MSASETQTQTQTQMQTEAVQTAGTNSTAPSSPLLLAHTGRNLSTVRFSSGASSSHGRSTPPLEPSSPAASRPTTIHRDRHESYRSYASSSGLLYKRPISNGSSLNFRRPYPSTKLRGEIEKPWTKYPDPAHRWARIIFWVLVALGFAVGGVSTLPFPLALTRWY
jgi:hypothetical protein